MLIITRPNDGEEFERLLGDGSYSDMSANMHLITVDSGLLHRDEEEVHSCRAPPGLYQMSRDGKCIPTVKTGDAAWKAAFATRLEKAQGSCRIYSGF